MKIIKHPTEAIIGVTYRCNARCRMCNIWAKGPQECLTAKDYEMLPSTLNNINITGGEPFLRRDIVDLVRTVYEKCKRPRIVISTNGLQTDRIVSVMEKLRRTIPNIAIGISLDGMLGMHDRIRGVSGGFKLATRTIQKLTEREFNDLRISLTTMKDNVDEIKQVFNLSCTMGVEFVATIAHNSDHYYGTKHNVLVSQEKVHHALDFVIKRELLSYHPKRWLRAYFNHGSLIFISEKRRLLRCHAGSDLFYLAPEGTIYPCLTMSKTLGNIRNDSFKKLWNSERAGLVRRSISGCEKCWMICTARTSFIRQIHKVLGWAAKEKIKVHLSKSFERQHRSLSE